MYGKKNKNEKKHDYILGFLLLTSEKEVRFQLLWHICINQPRSVVLLLYVCCLATIDHQILWISSMTESRFNPRHTMWFYTQWLNLQAKHENLHHNTIFTMFAELNDSILPVSSGQTSIQKIHSSKQRHFKHILNPLDRSQPTVDIPNSEHCLLHFTLVGSKLRGVLL